MPAASNNQRIWTISNFLSILRVLLIVPVAYFVLRREPGDGIIAFFLVIVAGLTDLFDGMLARKLNQVTELGKVIDPLADKMCVAVIGLILTLQHRLPIWFFVGAITRDIVILIGGIYIRRKMGLILMSNWAGKWAVAFIAFLFSVLILDIPQLDTLMYIFLAGSSILLVISSVLYAMRFMKEMQLYRVSR
jgi:CDP-diacylglycerol--glycerol-3-phosphate 3-phosphatidyltransferase